MIMRVVSIIAAFLFCAINIAMDGMMLYAIQIPDSRGLAIQFVVFLLSLLSMIGVAAGIVAVVILRKYWAERLMFLSLYAYLALNIQNVAALVLLPAGAFVLFVLKLTVASMRRQPHAPGAAVAATMRSGNAP